MTSGIRRGVHYELTTRQDRQFVTAVVRWRDGKTSSRDFSTLDWTLKETKARARSWAVDMIDDYLNEARRRP